MHIQSNKCFRSATAVLAAAMVSVCFAAAEAQGNSSKSQTVYLPDPTPRETDPRLIFGNDPAAAAKAQQSDAVRNAKRRQLVDWAADDLVLQSQRLKEEVAKHEPGATMEPFAARAERIETLAKGLKQAMKAQ